MYRPIVRNIEYARNTLGAFISLCRILQYMQVGVAII